MNSEGTIVEEQQRRARLFPWILGMVLFSGAAALSHQLLWTRRLIDLLGAGHESSARVFGTFFLGLALGAAIASVLVHRVRRPWRWIGWIELLVIVLTLPALFLPRWTDWIWPWLGPERLAGVEGGLVKLVFSLLVVLPPATAMGMSLPLMAPAVLRAGAALGRQGVWLYSVNTLGGVLGLGLTVLVFLHQFGLAGSMLAAIGLNFVVFGWAMALDRVDEPVAADQSRVRRPASTVGEPSWVRVPALLVAAASGFAILGFEVAGLQLLMLVAPMSFYAPAVILMVVILLLAVGAGFTPWVRSKFVRSPDALAVVMLTAGLLTVITPPLFFMVAGWTGGAPESSSLAVWVMRLGLLALLSIGPAVLAASLVFPLVLAWMSDEGGDPGGRSWGLLLAANGLGGLLGAELTYRLLLPMFGPHQAIGVIGTGYLLLAVLVAVISGSRPRWLVGLSAAACPAALAAIVFWLGGLPLVNERMGLTLLDHRSGREGTVAVIEGPGLGRAILMSNQYILGGTAARWDQERQAHLPLLLHSKPETVATIGMATGITPGAVLLHEPVGRLVTIELSPLVAELAERHFEAETNGLFADPRTQVVIEDGRTMIAASVEAFDVVLGDLFLPWGPGEARLYSAEHFQAVRRSLKPGGVFCQWLAMYQLTPEQLQVILATFAQAFPETHLLVHSFRSHQPVLGLVGFRDGGWDWAVIQERAAQARRDGVLDPLARHVEGVELVYLGRLEQVEPRRIHTLDNLLLELDAGRRRVTGRPETLYHSGRRWLETLRALEVSWEDRFGQVQDEPLLLKLIEAEAEPSRRPSADQIFELFVRLPIVLSGDAEADPARWPGDRRVLTGRP